MRFWRISTSIALAVLALGVGACGGDDEETSGSASTPEPTPTETAASSSSGSGGGGETLKIAAPEDGSLKFTESSWEAKAGKVKIDFDNPSSVPHAVEVEGSGVEKETEVVTKGKASVTVDLKAGTYEIYCPVGKHQQAGMEGTLTVN
jgi:plastocyanin